MDSETVPLGHINGVFGVRGWLKVFSDTAPRENIIEYKTWLLSGQAVKGNKALASRITAEGWCEVKLLEGRRQGKNVVVRLDGIDEREQAESLLGAKIAVRRSQLLALPEGEYYWSDLIGQTVVNREGQVLGVVKRLFETGANDVLVVEEGGREILIPWVLEHFVIHVDRDSRQILVDWQEDY